MSTPIVTLQNAKDYLKITASTDDTLLTDLVSKACDLAESFCDRVFALQTHAELYSGDGSMKLMLDNYPIVTVHHLSQDIDKENKVASSLYAPKYILIDTQTGIVEMFDENFSSSNRNIYIKYSAGYSDFPEDLKMAVLDIVAKRFYDLKDKRFGVSSKSTMGDTINFSYKDITDLAHKVFAFYKKPAAKNGIPVSGWTVQS